MKTPAAFDQTITVLLAEDEGFIRSFVSTVPKRQGFVVISASDAAEALEAFHSHKTVDLLVSDVQLGAGMNGVELAERILNESPTTKALLISGLPSSMAMASEKGLPFLSKPFLSNDLVQRLREVLEQEIPSSI